VKHDTHNPHEERHDEAASSAQAASGSPFGETTPETAVPTQPAPEPVHRWLDGEAVPESDLHAPDTEKHIQFWAKVNQETDRRHRMQTPRGLDAVIMNKLQPPVVKDD
jgi:hypothetical protein